MKSKTIVKEVLTLMKFDPIHFNYFIESEPLFLYQAVVDPVIEVEQNKRKLAEFSKNISHVEDKILAYYDACDDTLNSLMDQQLMIEDGLAELKRRNNRDFKNSSNLIKGKMNEVIDFGESIVSKIERLIKQKKIKESTDESKTKTLGFNELTPVLKIGPVKVKLNGAELAFYLQLFNNAGWLPDFEGKTLGTVFTQILDDNVSVLKDGEYQQLSYFHERLSQIGHIRQQESNEKKLKAFKQILTSTIERAEKQFLSDDNKHDLIKDKN